MAVSLRGATQGAYLATGSGTAAWPAGTVAGDLGVVCLVESKAGTPDSKPTPDGWVLKQPGSTTTVWYKRLTTADIAAALPVKAYGVMLQTFANCGKIGAATTTNGVTLSVAGAGLFGFCRADDDGATLTPAGGKLHATDIVNAANAGRTHNTWFVAHATTGYKSLATNADYMSCFELLPLEGPAAPTLNTPAAGAQIDPGDALTFSWLHKSSQGVPQDEFKLRIRQVSTGTWYYLTVAGTLSTTELSIATDDTFDVLNAGQLTSGLTYEWGVATLDSGTWGAWSTSRQLSAVAKPVVNSVTVTSPAGDLSPTIAWTATMGLGAQVSYRVYVRADAAPNRYLWDSGTKAGTATSVTLPTTVPWVNGETLRAWVEVRQTGGQWSLRTSDDVTFAVTWTPPAAPTAVTATNQADTPLRVTVTGLTIGNPTQVETSTDLGVTWQQLASTATPAAYESRRNYAIIPNPVSTTGWQTNNATLYPVSYDAAGGRRGGTGARKTVRAATTPSAVVASVFAVGLSAWAAANRVPVEAGQVWTVSSYSMADVAFTSSLTVAFFDAANVQVGAAITGSAVAGALNTWVRPYATVTVPATATNMGISQNVFKASGNTVGGEQAWMSDALFEMVASLDTYFDGGYSPGALVPSWTGAANASASILTATVLIIDLPMAVYGVESRFRARQGVVIDGQLMWSAWTVSAAADVASTDTAAYLGSTDGVEWLKVRVRQDDPQTIVEAFTVTYGIDATRAVVHRTPTAGLVGRTTFGGKTKSERETLIDFLQRNAAFVIRWSPEMEPSRALVDAGRTTVQRVSPLTIERITQYVVAFRDLPVEWVEA